MPTQRGPPPGCRFRLLEHGISNVTPPPALTALAVVAVTWTGSHHPPGDQLSQNRHPGCGMLGHPARDGDLHKNGAVSPPSQLISAEITRRSSANYSGTRIQPPRTTECRGRAWENTGHLEEWWEVRKIG